MPFIVPREVPRLPLASDRLCFNYLQNGAEFEKIYCSNIVGPKELRKLAQKITSKSPPMTGVNEFKLEIFSIIFRHLGYLGKISRKNIHKILYWQICQIFSFKYHRCHIECGAPIEYTTYCYIFLLYSRSSGKF